MFPHEKRSRVTPSPNIFIVLLSCILKFVKYFVPSIDSVEGSNTKPALHLTHTHACLFWPWEKTLTSARGKKRKKGRSSLPTPSMKWCSNVMTKQKLFLKGHPFGSSVSECKKWFNCEVIAKLYSKYIMITVVMKCMDWQSDFNEKYFFAFFGKAPSFEAREAHRYLNNRLGIFRARGGVY